MADKIYSYGKQTIDDDDIKAVVDVLKGDRLTQGLSVGKFEKKLCLKFGSSFCTVVSSGTAALHLSGLALGWKKGDIILTTPITFLSTANAILYAGATPDFVDIDEAAYTLDIDKLEEKIKYYHDKGKRIKAVVAVDYAGHPCDWKALRKLANENNFQLVNDNCHAIGAKYYGDIKYAAKYADIVIMSFHPVKHITTGEGGAVLTDNSEIDEKVRLFKTHGITKNHSKFKIQNSKSACPWYYEMQELGFNYRITDFQCALGSSQLEKLDLFVKLRREIAEVYDKKFENDDRFIIPKVSDNAKHAYHLYPLQIKFDELGIDKKEYFAKLKANRIIGQVHYIPVHLQPYYRERFGFKHGDFPVAEKFYDREISIPIYPELKNDDLEYIVDKLRVRL